MGNGPRQTRVVLFMVDSLSGPTVHVLQQTLLRLASSLALALPAGIEFQIGFCNVLRSLVETPVTLAFLGSLKPFELREVYTQVQKLKHSDSHCVTDTRKVALVLRSLVKFLAPEHQRCIPVQTSTQHKHKNIIVIAHSFTAVATLPNILQEASDQGINVSFVALSPLCGYLPGDTTWSEAAADAADETAAVQQAELALFAQALSGSDNAQLQQMNPDAVSMEHLISIWLAQLLPTVNTWKAAELLLPLPIHGSCTLRCLVTSQVLPWNPHVSVAGLCVCHGVLHSFCPANCADPVSRADPDSILINLGHHQIMRLIPESPSAQRFAESELSKHTPNVPYSSHVEEEPTAVVLTLERVCKASKVDDSVVWGWPFVLTPIMDLGTSLGNMGAAERRLAAIIQALSSEGEVLIASSPDDLDRTHCRLGESPQILAGFIHHYVLLPSSDGPPSLLMKQIACREQLVPPLLQPSAAATLQEVWSSCPHLRQSCVQEAKQAFNMLPGSSAALRASAMNQKVGALGSEPLRKGLGRSLGSEEDMETDLVATTSGEHGAAGQGIGVEARVGQGSIVGAGGGAECWTSPSPVMLLSSRCHNVVTTLVRDSMRVFKPLPPLPPAPAAAAKPAAGSAVATALAAVAARGAAATAAAAHTAAAATTRPVQSSTAQKAHPKAAVAPRKHAAGLWTEGHAATGVAEPGREAVKIAEASPAAVVAAVPAAPAAVPMPFQQPAGTVGRSDAQAKGLAQVRTGRALSVQPHRASLRLTSVSQERPQ